MEKLEFSFDLKEIGPTGEFEGWASTYDLDLGRDKVLPGAFATTIRKSKGVVPVLFNHDRNKIAGVGVSAAEDQRGLYVKARLAMSTQLGRETYELMQMGALKGLSIGYSIPDKGWVMDGKVRLLKAVDLHEYSATPFPMNPEAQVARVKSVDEMTERDFEEYLRRDVGLSQKEAKVLIAKGFRALKDQRDVDSEGDVVQAEAQAFLDRLSAINEKAAAEALLSKISLAL